MRINGRDVTDWTFREVMDALKELVTSTSSTPSRRRLKTLGFAPSGTAEWSRGTHTTTAISESMFFGRLFHSLQQSSENNTSSSTNQHAIHSKRLYSFVSFIGPRWRVASENNDEEQQKQQQQSSGNSSVLGQEQEQPVRQHSENSTSELERQLNKEPTINYGEDHDFAEDVPPMPPMALLSQKEEGDATANSTKKTYIQYEIQCHILFRDTSSFGTNHNNNHNNSNIHHSWSVWKRYSELQTLDEELRYDFSWQMDTLHDGKGFTFPSSHGLESWWYGLRNGGASSGGGGVMTSLLGGTDEVNGNWDTSIVPNTNVRNNDSNVQEDSSSSGWGSSLYGMFTRDDNSTKVNNDTRSPDNENNSSPSTSNTNCPFPTSFIERRRKELASYWTNLMKIEDIFEFGDIHSHKFGKAMASFLEVDKVLLSRKNATLPLSAGMASASSLTSGNYQQQQQQQYPSMAAIHENETEMFGRTSSSFRPSYGLSEVSPTREVSELTIHDDDVSILSDDGSGAFGDPATVHHRSSLDRGNLVVDAVPKAIESVSNGTSIPEKQEVRSSSTAASLSVNSNSRRRRGKAPRAKPAFQRQLLSP